MPNSLFKKGETKHPMNVSLAKRTKKCTQIVCVRIYVHIKTLRFATNALNVIRKYVMGVLIENISI